MPMLRGVALQLQRVAGGGLGYMVGPGLVTSRARAVPRLNFAGGGRLMSGGRLVNRAFYASPGKTVDIAPSPSTPAPGFYQRMQSTIKTQVTYYRMRNAMPPMDFAPETFPREAAEIYRQFMSALNRVDRSKLRDILTERMFSRFKSHLPDKKELIKAKKSEARQSGQERSTSDSSPIFVTGACSIVQARAVQIAAPVDTIFVQITCEVQVLQPERDVVRVVFERPISTEDSRWRICDLIR